MSTTPAPKTKPITPRQAKAGARLQKLLLPLIIKAFGTQEAFAGELGISKAAMQSWWKRGTIGADSIDKTALRLGISHSEIHAAIRVGGHEYPIAREPTAVYDSSAAHPPIPATRDKQRAEGWIGDEITPAQRELVRAVGLMARVIPDSRAKALADLVLQSGGAVAPPPGIEV